MSSRGTRAALIALVVAVVVLIILVVAFGIGWGKQKTSLDAVCTDLVGAEAVHVGQFLHAVKRLRANPNKTPRDAVRILTRFLRESYGVNAMYQNVAKYCPDMAASVQARMASHVGAASRAVDAAQSDPEGALAGVQSHLQAHAASLRAYLTGVGTALSAQWAAKADAAAQ